jgi:Cysteine-rich secretory protein family
MKLSSSLLGGLLFCFPLISAHEGHDEHESETKITGTCVEAPTTPPSASYTTQPDLMQSALNKTNAFRAQHNATALTWNTSLADAASAWASKCQWEHSGGECGENLALGYPSMADAIDAWGKERDSYDFKATAGFGERTGHFTQLVWKDTTSMGCAAIDCHDKNSLKGFMVICQYWPPGNVVGKDNEFFRQNVQAQVAAEVQPSPTSAVATVSSVRPSTTSHIAATVQQTSTTQESTTTPQISTAQATSTVEAISPAQVQVVKPIIQESSTSTSASTTSQSAATVHAKTTLQKTTAMQVPKISSIAQTTSETKTVVGISRGANYALTDSTRPASNFTKSNATEPKAMPYVDAADSLNATSWGSWAVGVTVAALVFAGTLM